MGPARVGAPQRRFGGDGGALAGRGAPAVPSQHAGGCFLWATGRRDAKARPRLPAHVSDCDIRRGHSPPASALATAFCRRWPVALTHAAHTYSRCGTQSLYVICVKPSNRSFVVCAAFRTAMPSAGRRTEEESGTQQQLDYFKQLRHARAWRCYLHYVTSRDLSDRRKGGQACECCPCEASFGTVAVLRQHGRNGLRCARGVCPCEHARFCSFPGKTL